MIMYTSIYAIGICSHVDSVLDKTKHYWSRIHVSPYIVQNIHNTCKQSFKELHKLYSIVVLRYFYCFVQYMSTYIYGSSAFTGKINRAINETGFCTNKKNICIENFVLTAPRNFAVKVIMSDHN
jgi:hypothetical protein